MTTSILRSVFAPHLPLLRPLLGRLLAALPLRLRHNVLGVLLWMFSSAVNYGMEFLGIISFIPRGRIIYIIP